MYTTRTTARRMITHENGVAWGYTSDIQRVLVVGGGVGGLTAAIALKQVGIDVEVIELRSEWRAYGIGVIQPNNALRALGRINLAEKCLALGAPFPGWRLCDASGNLLMEVATPNPGGPKYPPLNGISWSTLHGILTDAAREHDIPIRLGLTVSGLEDVGTHVNVEFSDQTRRSYNLVVGADGIRSRVRSLLFGDGPATSPRFTGQSVWRYSFNRPPEITYGMLFYGSQTKAGLVPISADTMYLLLVTSERGNALMPRESYDALMRERLKEYGGIVRSLTEQLRDPAAVTYRPMASLLLPAPWHKGRVVLIGDAAHTATPHLAQGASITMEDAVVLAELLSRGDPVAATLDAFMKRRFERCKLIVHTSHRLGELEQLEWQGQRDESADPAALMAGAWTRMAEPF